MNIGEIPIKMEKLSAIPQTLYRVEFTSYNQFHSEILAIVQSNQIKAYFFNKTNCHTTEFHYVGHYIKEPKSECLKPTDGFLITYLLYNETKSLFIHNVTYAREAYLIAKNKIGSYIEIVKLNRYRLVKEWRKEFVQPFIVETSYLSKKHFNTKYK